MKTLITTSLVLFTITCLMASSLAQARTYRYKDENGQTVISSSVPQSATRNGYEILNDKGRVVDTIAPAPTAQELEQRRAAREREQQERHRQREDRKLLKRYSHPDDAVRAMHRKVQELEGLNQLKEGNIAVIESQLDDEQSRAAERERSGQAIPESTLQRIDRLQDQIRDIEREIEAQNETISALREDYLQDIERLEQVTGQTRTLSLEPETATSAAAGS